jgi:hypothetical protein
MRFFTLASSPHRLASSNGHSGSSCLGGVDTFGALRPRLRAYTRLKLSTAIAIFAYPTRTTSIIALVIDLFSSPFRWHSAYRDLETMLQLALDQAV